MRVDAYDDDDEDGSVDNHVSGVAENSVQARDIYGDVSFYSTSDSYEEDYGILYGTVFRGAGLAYFAALFILAASYSSLIITGDLTFWDWIKLVVSTAVLVVVLVRTEWALFDDRFSSVRRLAIVLVFFLGFGEG